MNMEQKERIKEYKKGEDFKVIWKPAKCIHSEICVKTLPEVYHPNDKPWIRPEKAGVDALRAQIDKCPSGALTYVSGESGAANQTSAISARLMADGPLILKGDIRLEVKGEERLLSGNTAVTKKSNSRGNERLSSNSLQKYQTIMPMNIRLLVVALLLSQVLSSQKFDFTYDHYSFVVEDLTKTGDFYAEVLGLEEIPHPSDTLNFRWFRIEGNTQVHLIRKDRVVKTENKSVHLCLSIQDLDGYIAFLKEMEVAFWDWPGTLNSVTTRADGVRQIYVKDPEDNWIEINTAQH